jgi:hypothetical protein
VTSVLVPGWDGDPGRAVRPTDQLPIRYLPEWSCIERHGQPADRASVN